MHNFKNFFPHQICSIKHHKQKKTMKHFTKLLILLGFIGMMSLNANTANAQNVRRIRWTYKYTGGGTVSYTNTFSITSKNDNSSNPPSYFDVTVQSTSANYPEPSQISFACKSDKTKSNI